MAPNTKQLSAILAQLSPANLHIVKAAFFPLTQEAQPQQKASSPAELDNYWSWSEEPTECDNYWDFSANLTQDILSSSHITFNLVKSHTEKTHVLHSGIDSNDYWDERSTKDREPVTAQHVNEEAVESYWDWSPVDERAAIIAGIMKNEQARQLFTTEHITATLKQTASDMYWAEQEAQAHADSQRYCDRSNPPIATSGDGYWAW